MRGRKRTPSVLKLLRGNPGKRALNAAEPLPGALEVACPAVLADAVARAEWERAIVPAIAIGQVTAADRALAIAHCELWATWQSQLAEAVKHPHVIAVGKGRYPTPNPARIMANKTLQLLAGVDEKLGFSPTSRSKVSVKGPGTIRATLDRQRARFFEASRG
jgi:P27 family predicted phage terminase small subunit